jgi:DNA-binding transcriptional MerR regulator
MPNPTLEERLAGYITAPEVAKKIGLSYRQLDYWLRKGILPQPTVTRKDGVRLFAPEWLERARQVAERLKGGQSHGGV